jgi:hypothetical protein
MMFWDLLNRVESEIMILVASDPEIVDDGRRGGSKMHVGSGQIVIMMRTACETKEAKRVVEVSHTGRVGE